MAPIESSATMNQKEQGKKDPGPVKKEKGSKGSANKPVRLEPFKWTNIIIKQAISMAKKIGADAILFYMDSTKDLRPISQIESDIKVILLTKRKECMEKSSALPLHTLMIPDVQLTRTGYIKIGFLSAISKGLLKNGDVIGLGTGTELVFRQPATGFKGVVPA